MMQCASLKRRMRQRKELFDHQCLLTVRQQGSPPSHPTHFRLADPLSRGMELEVREKVEVKWALISPANSTVYVCACVSEKGSDQLTEAKS